MLSNANLTKVFWGMVVSKVVYIINRSPSSSLNHKTPQELWTSKPPKLDH